MNSLASQPGTSPGPAPQEYVTSAAPDRVRVLIDRLNSGWALIEIETDPAQRSRLEAHWLELLRAYEAACDGAATGAAEPVSR